MEVHSFGRQRKAQEAQEESKCLLYY